MNIDIYLENIYIADLDALALRKDNKNLIKKIFLTFPNINFLLDAGFNYPIIISFYFIHVNNKLIFFSKYYESKKIKNINNN